MRFGLATRFSIAVLGVVGLAIVSSATGLYSSRAMSTLLDRAIQQNLASVRAAEELEIALLEQRGLVSSYILAEGDEAKLQELPEKEANFQKWLDKAQGSAHAEEEYRILRELAVVYQRYSSARRHVLDLYERGDKSRATEVLLGEVSELYLEAYDLCEDFIGANMRFVDDNMAEAALQTRRARWVASTVALLTLALGGGLLWLFFAGVLFPLRRMLANARTFAGDSDSGRSVGDEMHEVGKHLQLLMSDVAETRSSLEENRLRLSIAEKLAAVGRLAASVAHEIRNPLTAVKMWLFSIRGAVASDPELDRKFGIVAEEIGRLESIIGDFLEFSRPTPLKLEPCDLRDVVRRTADLLACRCQEKGIRLACTMPERPLPVVVDSGQLRQVFINLLNNSVEAVSHGAIEVSGHATTDGEGRSMAVVRVADTGDGMPYDVREKIFDPFFTTKDGGTGLGLSIAAQIIARHSGRLVLESSTEQGTVFAVSLPIDTGACG
ncbi:MAG: MCP four helix bundle domain-containing protein [Thermoguttaceae bacterium]|nr:MCP four helix bundle domain-containing protein [Thermoguttaceae bacterium]